MGVIVERAFLILRHDRSVMLPESSIRKTVSNYVRKTYLESAVINIELEITAVGVVGE